MDSHISDKNSSTVTDNKPSLGIQNSFAQVLQNFRINFGENGLKDVIHSLKVITYEQLLNAYTDKSDDVTNDDVQTLTLESKLWSLMEALFDAKFASQMLKQNERSKSKELISSKVETCSYTSVSLIKDNILHQNQLLLQLYAAFQSLSESSNLDSSKEIDSSKLQSSKWLNTRLQIQIGQNSNTLITHLDADSPLRENHNIDERDLESDEAFFRQAFQLLITGDIEKLIELCKVTNNWDFAMSCYGAQNYVNPAIDLSDFNSKPIGIKHGLLWRRCVYKATQATKSKYQRACYGYLCGDFTSSAEAADTWDSKLIVYMNNFIQCTLDTEILRYYQRVGKADELDMIGSLPTPPRASTGISDILNKLAADPNEQIQRQSKHPMRVLIGSIISDNVGNLMKDALKLTENAAGLDTSEMNIDLFRILVHIAIILHLIYGESVITTQEYTKLLESYVKYLTSLGLYKEIPTYIAFIPDDDKLVEIYAQFLSSCEFSAEQRAYQIKLMQQLNLNTDVILKSTVEKSFKISESSYPVDREVRLTDEITDEDRRFYQCIYWFYDSSMSSDCMEAIVMLFRRFLTCGKLQAAVEFLGTISLPSVINDYREKINIEDGDNSNLVISESIMKELIEYQRLIEVFDALGKFTPAEEDASDDKKTQSLREVAKLASSLDQLLKSWMYDLSNNYDLKREDREMYQELRRIYIPPIFISLFDLLVNYSYLGRDILFQQAMNLINLLADDKYKFYEMFNSINALEPFLQKLSSISCEAYGKRKTGIYE